MKLIVSDAILRKYIPNVLATVTGEMSLFDELSPYIELAEEWVKQTFTSESTFNTICGYTDANVIKVYTAKVVVSHAFMNAVPSLDLILTPNGFGIVNNQNVVPASKERVERLIASLEAERDRAIRLLLTSLPGASKWLQSSQYAYFAATMFPNLDLCDFMGYDEHLWQRYQELRPLVLDIEQHIETNYLGTGQMNAFRQEVIMPTAGANTLTKSIIRPLRTEILQRVKKRQGNPSPSTPYADTQLVHIVDIIRNNPAEFPLWHSSSVKDLFTPPVYENKKEDSGYWF